MQERKNFINATRSIHTNKFDLENCSEFIETSPDRLIATNYTDYKTITSCYSYSKTAFFEIEVICDKGIRVGFAKEGLNRLGPLGYDNKGFSYGSKSGYTFYNSIKQRYADGYTKNDIIGVLYCKKDDSYIKYFKNGVDLGIAFYKLDDVEYFPAVALYGGSTVRINFGPYFAYPEDLN